MLHLCQRDAYCQEASCQVLAVEEGESGAVFALLQDSVLYPEGGGQPCDWGLINGVPVRDVQKHAPGVVRCLIDGPVDVGDAEVVVDWVRRFDHMQQHTAQHLLTALANSRLDAPTVGFHLGELYSAIELDVDSFDEVRQRQLLAWANECIRQNLSVHWNVYSPEAYEQKRQEVRSRRLPAGHEGDIRVIEIEGLDVNTCGGTHVRSLGELQMIAFTGVERIRKRVRLRFLAGERVLLLFQKQLQREQAMTSLLNMPPEQHLEQVTSQGEAVRQERRRANLLQTELAKALGQQLASGPGRFHSLHRQPGDIGMLQAIAAACLDQAPDACVCLTASEEEAGEGVFVLMGPPAFVKEAGQLATTHMKGKGGGKPGTFQGKVTEIEQRAAAIEAIEKYWQSHQATGD